MTPNPLVGTWKLVSHEIKLLRGIKVIYPFGKEPLGYLMYTEYGYMSVNIMNANRPKLASGIFKKASTEEKLKATETYAAYCGKYEIREDKVIHKTEVSLDPNLVGEDQERIFKITDNQLLLSIPSLNIGGGRLSASYVVWERVTQ